MVPGSPSLASPASLAFELQLCAAALPFGGDGPQGCTRHTDGRRSHNFLTVLAHRLYHCCQWGSQTRCSFSQRSNSSSKSLVPICTRTASGGNLYLAKDESIHCPLTIVKGVWITSIPRSDKYCLSASAAAHAFSVGLLDGSAASCSEDSTRAPDGSGSPGLGRCEYTVMPLAPEPSVMGSRISWGTHLASARNRFSRRPANLMASMVALLSVSNSIGLRVGASRNVGGLMACIHTGVSQYLRSVLNWVHSVPKIAALPVNTLPKLAKSSWALAAFRLASAARSAASAASFSKIAAFSTAAARNSLSSWCERISNQVSAHRPTTRIANPIFGTTGRQPSVLKSWRCSAPSRATPITTITVATITPHSLILITNFDLVQTAAQANRVARIRLVTRIPKIRPVPLVGVGVVLVAIYSRRRHLAGVDPSEIACKRFHRGTSPSVCGSVIMSWFCHTRTKSQKDNPPFRAWDLLFELGKMTG
jgi:hypothetical protein